MMKYLDIFTANDGVDKSDRHFGYAGINDRGGYFFTWMPTLEQTLASIEADEIYPPDNFSKRAQQEIRGMIRRRWAKERAKPFSTLIPCE